MEGFASPFNAFNYNISGVKIVHAGFVEVAFFKKKPLYVLVWDAEAVLSYLKEIFLYKTYYKKDVEIVVASLEFSDDGYLDRNLSNQK